MAAGTRRMDRPSLKFPKSSITSAIIGDSQSKYLFQHFDPHASDSPGFIPYSGACISDVPVLTRDLPATVSRLVLHVGTNDIARNGATRSSQDFVQILRDLLRKPPGLVSVHVSLVLPLQPNRRRGGRNGRFVRRFNLEARNFNLEMRRISREVLTNVYYIDHGFTDLPPQRFLAADGLHPSFEGVALLAQHLKEVQGYGRHTTSAWLDNISTAMPTNEDSAARSP
ncbi:unnamed protein product, partial [Ixodes hexagonus]